MLAFPFASVAAPLQPEEGETPVASAFLRAERHTGSNFLEEILGFNFRRKVPILRYTNPALPTNGSCWRMRLSISAECYVPTEFFSGCNTRTAGAQGSADFCCWKHGMACSPDEYVPRTSATVLSNPAFEPT